MANLEFENQSETFMKENSIKKQGKNSNSILALYLLNYLR